MSKLSSMEIVTRRNDAREKAEAHRIVITEKIRKNREDGIARIISHLEQGNKRRLAKGLSAIKLPDNIVLRGNHER